MLFCVVDSVSAGGSHRGPITAPGRAAVLSERPADMTVRPASLAGKQAPVAPRTSTPAGPRAMQRAPAETSAPEDDVRDHVVRKGQHGHGGVPSNRWGEPVRRPNRGDERGTGGIGVTSTAAAWRRRKNQRNDGRPRQRGKARRPEGISAPNAGSPALRRCAGPPAPRRRSPPAGSAPVPASAPARAAPERPHRSRHSPPSCRPRS